MTVNLIMVWLQKRFKVVKPDLEKTRFGLSTINQEWLLMQHTETLIALVEKAAKQVGSEANLARALGIPQTHITNWKSGDRTCTPEDRARLAGFAREDALQELVRAVLEKTAGTLRGEQLRQVLGKSLHQIIAGVGIALLLAGSLTFGSADAIGAVALFVFFLYSTMYIKNVFIMKRRSEFVAFG